MEVVLFFNFYFYTAWTVLLSVDALFGERCVCIGRDRSCARAASTENSEARCGIMQLPAMQPSDMQTSSTFALDRCCSECRHRFPDGERLSASLAGAQRELACASPYEIPRTGNRLQAAGCSLQNCIGGCLTWYEQVQECTADDQDLYNWGAYQLGITALPTE